MSNQDEVVVTEIQPNAPVTGELGMCLLFQILQTLLSHTGKLFIAKFVSFLLLKISATIINHGDLSLVWRR